MSPTDYHRFIYKCHKCLLGFKRRGMLVNHLAKRHPDIPLETVPELNLPILKTTKDYFCQYCNKVRRLKKKTCQIEWNSVLHSLNVNKVPRFIPSKRSGFCTASLECKQSLTNVFIKSDFLRHLNVNKDSRIFPSKRKELCTASLEYKQSFTNLFVGFFGRGSYIYDLVILCFRPFEVAMLRTWHYSSTRILPIGSSASP